MLEGENQQEKGVMFDSLKCSSFTVSLAQQGRVSFSQWDGCLGRVLGTVKGFLRQNNQSYRPHFGDNTLSFFFPFLCLSFTLSHIVIKFPVSKATQKQSIIVKIFMESICMLLCSKLLRCVICLLNEIANSQFFLAMVLYVPRLDRCYE